MTFEPMGGFPPFVRKTDITKEEKPSELRGFSTTNIVNISNIMEKKKKDVFLAIGSEEEGGFGEEDYLLSDALFESPESYDRITYKEPLKKKSRK
jgi:hypothetical protein